MSILDKLTMKRTHNRRVDSFYQPTLILDCEKTGEIIPYRLDANEEWCLSGTIQIKFWANSAQLSSARSYAEKALLSRLYNDIHQILPELRLAISNGDKHLSFSLCDEIADCLTT